MPVAQFMEKARMAAEQAYAPYSQFRVGCVVETHAGNFYTGCNVENISFGLTCCAERNAIFHAVSQEGPGMRLKSVYVAMADGKEGSPCGACRQVIGEFDDQTKVFFVRNNAVVETSVSALLPHQFRAL